MAVKGHEPELFFTLQALHLYQDLTDVEILVVDNGGNPNIEEWMGSWRRGKYVLYTDIHGTSQPRNEVFKQASGRFVVCIDPHVMLATDAVKKTVEWLKKNDTDDLFQGPLLYDSCDCVSTHWENVWRADMWGIWSDAIETWKLPPEPFEIYMQGLGLFGAKKETWLEFNPMFRGFGGEEGYIHEKYRRAGRTTLCLPWLQWFHYFGGGSGTMVVDRIRNYLIGFNELGLNDAPIYKMFGVKVVDAVKEKL